MHIKEIKTVSNLKPFDRYNYFIKKIADFETLYTLKNLEGDFAISEVDNHFMFPLWSHKEFATLNLDKEWQYFTIFEISLEELTDEIFPFILKNDYLINVFPMNDKTGFVVSLEELKRDLSEELENYQ